MVPAEGIKLKIGDCRDVMAQLAPDSVDAIVTDPPYGLGFMGKGWDHGVPNLELWREALRVAKPGAHLLAFGGTRTFHRLASAIEDAGWEIRDCLGWLYGSGFPKSLDVSKAIDKAAGAEREVVGYWKPAGTARPSKGGSHSCAKTTADCGYDPDTEALVPITAPATEEAKKWQGWGTALKPAWEPIVMARKPLAGTVAANVLEHGTGAINVDGCRVGTEAVTINTWDDGAKPFGGGAGHQYTGRTVQGRWPANLIHDGSDEVVGLFPQGGSGSGQVKVSSGHKSGGGSWAQDHGMQKAGAENTGVRDFGDSGSAARFFYCAKASKCDRGPDNRHPTVKPSALMRYLVRLVTPPGGIVLDPFAGSGTTGVACVREGFRALLIEQEEAYAATIVDRISKEASK